ncbi:type II toxin-antitoxin system VapC family toxin [Patescibacteria group bacterium]|nr:type II toxin-antitoxin system VapC family toxin [Patescibacteria group bacterium]
MKKYLLDTNICIYIIKEKPYTVIKQLKSKNISDIAISSITLAELEYGVEHSSKQLQNRIALSQFLAPIDVISFDGMSAYEYGRIRNDLQKKGSIIGPLDLFIAAHAVSLNRILVSNNIKEFQRVDGLKIENWV